MAQEKEYDLEHPQHLLAFLIDANIRLVRAEYLLHLEKEKRLWPRRQEAEHETFQHEDGSVKTALVTLEEYEQAFDFDEYMYNGLLRLKCYVLSVSHCWEAKQHPDPFAFQAGDLLAKLGAFPSESFSPWVFIDFICLPQYYRTPQEQVFFKRAMANMHVLYAHRNVREVFRLENLADESAKASPPAFIDIYYEEEGAQPGSGKFGPQPFSKLELNVTPYHERGWCVAEIQWMCTKTIFKGFAPMTPATFRERVERGHQKLPDGIALKFTHRSDEEIVMKLQEKIFLQQAPRRQKLWVQQLPESQLLLLAESLPHFVNLETMDFSDLEIPEMAIAALITGLKTLRHLKTLIFSSCKMEEKGARLLANGLCDCQLTGDLRVRVDKGSEHEKLANELGSLEKTGRVVQKGPFNDKTFCVQTGKVHETTYHVYTIKAASLKAIGWPFGWLERQLAKFASCKKRTTDPPCATPDDAHV